MKLLPTYIVSPAFHIGIIYQEYYLIKENSLYIRCPYTTANRYHIDALIAFGTWKRVNKPNDIT